MSYLILVRHGQSVWNLEKKFTVPDSEGTIAPDPETVKIYQNL